MSKRNGQNSENQNHPVDDRVDPICEPRAGHWAWFRHYSAGVLPTGVTSPFHQLRASAGVLSVIAWLQQSTSEQQEYSLWNEGRPNRRVSTWRCRRALLSRDEFHP